MNWQSLIMTKGGKLPKAPWNALVRTLRSAIINNVVGGELVRTSSGTSLVIAAQVGGGVTAVDHPWKPYASSEGKFRVIPGSVDNIVPSNWDSEFAVTNADGRWVYLVCTMAQEGVCSSASIAQASSVPATDLPDDDGSIPATINVPLFAYDAANDAVTKYYSVKTANLSTQIQTTEGGCDVVIRSAVIVQ